jgi:hypothetical protein
MPRKKRTTPDASTGRMLGAPYEWEHDRRLMKRIERREVREAVGGLSSMTTTDRPLYFVRAKRWEHGWELHIDDVGVTQSHELGDDAERMVRDYISLNTGVEPNGFDIEIAAEW